LAVCEPRHAANGQPTRKALLARRDALLDELQAFEQAQPAKTPPASKSRKPRKRSEVLSQLEAVYQQLEDATE
jgi:hypothetical protein